MILYIVANQMFTAAPDKSYYMVFEAWNSIKIDLREIGWGTMD
jgi:hypothetical protein